MRFDWCKTNLHPACYDYTQDHCEGCNIARAYLHGYKTAQGDAPKTSEWIPCSKRLPKTGEQVLCCDCQSRVFTSALTEIASNGMTFFGQHCKVIAWQPLPEPYRENGEE